MREYNWKSSVEKYLEHLSERKVIIVGNDIFTLEIYNTIKALGHPISYALTQNSDVFDKEDIEFLTEGEIDNEIIKKNFFLVAGLSGHKEAYTLLTQRGAELNKDFAVMGIGGYTKLLDAIDSLLTLNRMEDEFVGFKKITNAENGEGGYRIVILGNSTSDHSTGNLKSWPEQFFERFDKAQIKVTIYNGAITGYSSTQEYLKLNRDVFNLKPDLVISFSGYNDVKDNSTVENFPYLHKYEKKFYEFLKGNPKLAPDSMYVRNVSIITHGLETEKKDYEIWLDNMRSMKAVCSEFDVRFRAYLQPMAEYLGPFKSQQSMRIIDEFLKITSNTTMAQNEIAFCQGAKRYIPTYSYIKDLTGIFQERRDERSIYYDTCHCTEYGNSILAEMIYKDILENFILREKRYEKKN